MFGQALWFSPHDKRIGAPHIDEIGFSGLPKTVELGGVTGYPRFTSAPALYNYTDDNDDNDRNNCDDDNEP
ncbi:hypothetical protein V501_07101 [Pseudogymnoascus sp. VKM F-4519 (FW-2642)]|nr:hypothetical protein V501_07101 [Pseudogymnoascus sp. VKM F-4519 (FW-2642)]